MKGFEEKVPSEGFWGENSRSYGIMDRGCAWVEEITIIKASSRLTEYGVETSKDQVDHVVMDIVFYTTYLKFTMKKEFEDYR